MPKLDKETHVKAYFAIPWFFAEESKLETLRDLEQQAENTPDRHYLHNKFEVWAPFAEETSEDLLEMIDQLATWFISYSEQNN